METICGACRYFKVTGERDDGRLGVCRLEKVMGVFRESMRACPSFSRHGEANPPVVIDSARRARPERRPMSGSAQPAVFVSGGTLHAVLNNLSGDQLKAALQSVLGDASLLTEVELGRHWTAGQMELTTAEDRAHPKAVGLEVYFHKIVMMRDNLRVLEQKVNSHAQLHDAEKVDLQRRVTQCYQALGEMATGWVVTDHDDPGEGVARLRELLAELRWRSLILPPPTLAERWVGGAARYVVDGQSVEEPLERFFERLVVLRDRLHALEAQIGAHAHIAPDEADSMVSYIRRCYGTLTTYNILFRDREAYFTSTK
jgi:hypothetical protein